MKIKIEVDETALESEVVIRCAGLTKEVQLIQQALSEIAAGNQRFIFYKGETEYYIELNEILFFETDDGIINVHTAKDVYHTKLKLYELKERLPGYFMRVSKSAILNVNKIYSMTRNLSTCLVEFTKSHKQVYVSRYYFKPLKEKLEEMRMRR